MERYTAEALEAMGYVGWQQNIWTGNRLEAASAVRDVASTANGAPANLTFTRDDVRKTVRVWLPAHGNIQRFIERPMTLPEEMEADIRLAAMGVTVREG